MLILIFIRIQSKSLASSDSIAYKATPSSSLFASHNNTTTNTSTPHTTHSTSHTAPKDIHDKTAPTVEKEKEVENEEEVGKKRQFHIVKGGKMDAFFVKKVIHHLLYIHYIVYIAV